MANSTIEIELVKVLERIEQNLADFRQETEQNFADFRKETNQRFDKIEERLTGLEIGQARLEERLTGEIKTANARESSRSTKIDKNKLCHCEVALPALILIRQFDCLRYAMEDMLPTAS